MADNTAENMPAQDVSPIAAEVNADSEDIFREPSDDYINLPHPRIANLRVTIGAPLKGPKAKCVICRRPVRGRPTYTHIGCKHSMHRNCSNKPRSAAKRVRGCRTCRQVLALNPRITRTSTDSSRQQRPATNLSAVQVGQLTALIITNPLAYRLPAR